MKKQNIPFQFVLIRINSMFLLFIFFLFSLHFSFAQESSKLIVLQASSKIEAKLGYTFNYKMPFMQGENPLVEGNNINFELTAEASPISLNGVVAATLTPIAFLEFSLGTRVGTGWTINLFGSERHGFGLTKADQNDDKIIVNNGGLYTRFYASGTFQFDLAAIFPGDWNHVVFRTIHEINYSANTKAKGTETWFFESQSKEYINGFYYYSSYVLGYQMPIFISMVAFMAEAEKNFYDIPNQKDWGGHHIHWMLSFPVVFFEINKHLEIMTAVQFITKKNYLETEWKDKYHRTLTVDRSNPLRIEFYRVAAIATYRF